jgi:uncharacterized protein YfaS (alpha-2-macroglobulin family)
MLPPMGENVKAEAAPSGKNTDHLKLVGVYPLSGTPVERQAILYLSEPLVSPRDSNGNDMAPIALEPSEAKASYSVMDNHVVLNLDGGLKDLPFSFVSIRLDPALRSVSGSALDPATQPVLLSTGKEGGFAVNSCTLADGRLVAKMTGPFSAPLLEKYYTRIVTDPKGTPLTAEFQTEGPASAKFSVGTSVTADALPVTATFTRNTEPGGPLDAWLPPAMKTALPQGNPITIVRAEWQKSTGDTRDTLKVTLSHNVKSADLVNQVKVTREDNNTPVGYTVPESAARSEWTRFLEATLDAAALGDAKSLVLEITPPFVLKDGYLLAPLRQTLAPQTVEQAAADDNAEPEEKTLHSNWQYWEQAGLEGLQYVINFNAPVDPEALRKVLTISPELPNLTVKTKGDRIVLGGDWKTGQQYQISIGNTLTSVDGRLAIQGGFALQTEAAPKVMAVGLNLPAGRFYIARKDLGPMPMAARNITEATIRLSRLFPSNIAQAVNEMNDGKTYGYFDEQYTEPLSKRDLVFPDKPDTLNTMPMNVDELMPADKRGVFTLHSASKGREYDTKILLWTDIGLVSHFKDDELIVFAHNLYTLEPLPAAKVTVYSNKSQVLASADTDATGVARFSGLEARLGKPTVVVAETAQDATFLALVKREEDNAPFKENMPKFEKDGYDAYLYLDRNLYRPGETVHARWIVRTRITDAAANVPLLFQVQTPKNRLLQSTPVTLSELGTGGVELKTEKPFQTGKYTVELRVPGAKEPIGTAFFNLEEFVPNRMKATVTVDKALWKPEEAVSIGVKAENLYGGAAANRLSEALIILRPGEFKADKWPGFSFTNDDKLEPILEKLGQQQTDAEGNAQYTFTYTARDKVTTPLQASVRGMVFELGGREVRAKTDAVVFPAPIALGLAVAPVAGQASAEVSVAAITADQAPAALEKVSVALEREDWIYNVRHYDSHNAPWYIKVFRLVEDRTVALQNGTGKTSFDFNNSWGRYRIRVHAPETPLFSSTVVNSRWNSIETDRVVSKPELIDLRLNKDLYDMGDTCELHIRSPFDGTAFIAVQGDSFKQTFTQPIAQGEGMISFPITDQHYPNAWLEVTVVRRVDKEKTQAYPFSSFAMVNVPVNDGRRHINVTYPGLPAEIRPAQKVDFVVETRDNAGNPVAAEVTLAAVDEGIHNILDYANPDPYTWFQRSRQVDLRRAHYYDKVAYDFDPAAIGGDAMEKRLGGAPQIGDNWIKPVALWSGAVTTDAGGRATVSFDVPEFNGQLRLVAVAVDKTATGTTAASLYVRRPYILQTSMPRFALFGDQFGCGVTVINTTAEGRRAVVRWRTEGTLVGQGEKKIDLAPGKDTYFKADFTTKAIGQGKILWEVDILNAADDTVLEHLAQDAPIPVRPPAAWRTDHALAAVNPGETKTYQNTAFIDDESVALNMTATANPLYRLQRNLNFLIHYPYGCVEQTTSSVMPLYLIQKSPEMLLGLKDLPENVEPAKMVGGYIQAGVSRLFSMQTANGGLAYWPGGTDAYPYGSVYAAHFLTMVFKDNAATVPEKSFRSLQDYLRKIMKGSAETALSENSSYLYTRAYACYVLCLDGQLDAIEYIPRFDTVTMPETARWLLAAALARNTADSPRVKKYLETAPSKPFEEKEYSRTLNSEVRNTAVRLLAGTEMNLPGTKLQPLVNTLAGWLEKHSYYGMTTHDAAFVFAALGQYMGKVRAGAAQSSALITAPDGEKAISGFEVYKGRAKGAAQTFVVKNTGAVPIVVNFISEGVPLQPRTEALSEGGLTVARSFVTDRGTPIQTDTPFTHGGMYLVDLKLKLDADKENIVLSDLLPAGLEVANPRLDADAVAALGLGKAESSEEAAKENGEGGDENADDGGGEEGYEGDGDGGGDEGDGGESSENTPPEESTQNNAGVTPTFLEVRDDRLVLAFDKLRAGEHHFYYAVRAVTPGTFRQPAAVSECMYDPTVRAATVDTTVKVE